MIFDFSVLEEKGYIKIGSSQIKKMTTDDISNNAFGYLENYEKMRFRFIRFPDQLIEFRNEKHETIKVFGLSCFGFLFIGSDEIIYLIPDDDACFTQAKVFVNSSLSVFLRSYSLFMASMFTLKASTIYKDTVYIEIANNVSAKLDNDIYQTDATATQEGTFWGQLIYMIDDSLIKLDLPITDYIDAGRL